jgi:hypothetical protein
MFSDEIPGALYLSFDLGNNLVRRPKNTVAVIIQPPSSTYYPIHILVYFKTQKLKGPKFPPNFPLFEYRICFGFRYSDFEFMDVTQSPGWQRPLGSERAELVA